MLFILAIDPLHRLLQIATERGLLTKLNGRAARFRASMHADDAVIFLKPSLPDVNNLKSILLNFGTVTGLQTNLQKTSVTPIACTGLDINAILANSPVTRAAFPLKYLGLPLTPRHLKRMDFQPLVDKATGNLSTWNGRNLTQAGRACLTKVVLSSQPVYLMTVIKLPKEVLKDIDKIRRRFLWAGDKALSSGKCKVNWAKTTLPRELGGLGLLSLEKFARAFGCAGYGRNGQLEIRLGWGRRCHATMLTGDSLHVARESHWGMGTKRPSGSLAGYKENNPRT
jgi:hypothetical protein